MYRTILIGTCRSGNFRATAHDLDKHTQKQHKKDSRSNFYRCDPIAFIGRRKKSTDHQNNRKNICDQTKYTKKETADSISNCPADSKITDKK